MKPSVDGIHCNYYPGLPRSRFVYLCSVYKKSICNHCVYMYVYLCTMYIVDTYVLYRNKHEVTVTWYATPVQCGVCSDFKFMKVCSSLPWPVLWAPTAASSALVSLVHVYYTCIWSDHVDLCTSYTKKINLCTPSKCQIVHSYMTSLMLTVAGVVVQFTLLVRNENFKDKTFTNWLHSIIGWVRCYVYM